MTQWQRSVMTRIALALWTLNHGFAMIGLFGYLLIFAVAVILILLVRVIFFIFREEQAVEIELREIEKNSTR